MDTRFTRGKFPQPYTHLISLQPSNNSNLIKLEGSYHPNPRKSCFRLIFSFRLNPSSLIGIFDLIYYTQNPFFQSDTRNDWRRVEVLATAFLSEN